MSEADDAYLHVSLDHVQLKSQSQDYMVISGSAIWLQNLNCAEIPRKCLSQDRRLKDSAYQDLVLNDKLDRHYARYMACEIQLIFLCSLLLRWSLQNLILVLTSLYKVLIWY